MLRAIMLVLMMSVPVVSEIDHFDAISDGFIHAAVADVVHEPIENALTPTVETYYVCTESSLDWLPTTQEKCYTDILDYKIITPPHPAVVLVINIILILFLILIVIWCCVSSVEEKGEMCSYIICHMIGAIIYDILCGDDND